MMNVDTKPLVRLFTLSLAAASVSPGCFEGGGLNQNQVGPGSGDEGVLLAFGELAVDPAGQYFLTRVEDRLLEVEIASGAKSDHPSVGDPDRVAFAHDGRHYYLLAHTPKGERFLKWDRLERANAWALDVEIEEGWDHDGPTVFPKIAASEDDSRIILSWQSHLKVYDAESGDLLYGKSYEQPIRDIDVSPDQNRLLVTLEHEWLDGEDLPNTQLETVDMYNGMEASLSVPNCSSELVVNELSSYAFLAPSSCERDPVSVIDLETNEFVRNLPGFGPVGIAPRGDLALAFIDTGAIDETLFLDGDPDPASLEDGYHLMLIDTATLAFDTVFVGNEVPRYAMTPEGKIVLVDSPGWFSDARIRVLDVESKSLEPVAGPAVQLDNYAISSTGDDAWLLDSGLYHMDIPGKVIDTVAITFTPTNLNITPDDANLILREDDGLVWIYDLVAGELSHQIQAE